MAIGVPYDTFWHLTPNELDYFFKAHNEQKKIQDEFAWYLGLYIKSAIVSSFSKGVNYCEKPMMKDFQLENGELTEEEKKKEVDMFFARNKIARMNWKRNHKKK